jgi:coenzyme Q-binding protein COQ10
LPTHAERRPLPYSPQQMYDLVAAIEKYPEFLPWVQGVRVTKREENTIYADLIVGFRMFRESFTSKVTLQPPGTIDVKYLKGPLKYLNNHWQFEPDGEGCCIVDFYVDFEFRSRIFQSLAGALFNEAVRRMIHAFEARADAIYGGGKPGPAKAAPEEA